MRFPGCSHEILRRLPRHPQEAPKKHFQGTPGSSQDVLRSFQETYKTYRLPGRSRKLLGFFRSFEIHKRVQDVPRSLLEVLGKFLGRFRRPKKFPGKSRNLLGCAKFPPGGTNLPGPSLELSRTLAETLRKL